LTISNLQAPKTKQKNNVAPINGNQTEQSAYQAAVDFILKSKDYDKAISAFTAFVANYPKSTLVANSYYWLGQLYYKKQQFKNAQQSFAEVVNNFSKSAKRSDAILKIGVIDETLGDVPSAKKAYNKVLKEYPNSSPAELAAKRLKELR
jgi:tol-pal system protein YbgF